MKNKSGKIYILWNPLLKECVIKIGRTIRKSEVRAKEISSSTGVPFDYEVVYEEDVLDCVLAEKLVHEYFSSKRVNPKREFFKVPLKEAVKVVFKTCLKVNNKLIKRVGKRLAVYLDVTHLEEPGLVKLKKLLLKYKGKVPVFLLLNTKSHKQIQLLVGNDLFIKFSPEFINECKKIKGIGGIEWYAEKVTRDGDVSEKVESIDWSS